MPDTLAIFKAGHQSMLDGAEFLVAYGACIHVRDER
jgi:hypothetical protein